MPNLEISLGWIAVQLKLTERQLHFDLDFESNQINACSQWIEAAADDEVEEEEMEMHIKAKSSHWVIKIEDAFRTARSGIKWAALWLHAAHSCNGLSPIITTKLSKKKNCLEIKNKQTVNAAVNSYSMNLLLCRQLKHNYCPGHIWYGEWQWKLKHCSAARAARRETLAAKAVFFSLLQYTLTESILNLSRLVQACMPFNYLWQ